MNPQACSTRLLRFVLSWGLLLSVAWVGMGCATGGPQGAQGPIFYPNPPQQPRVQFLTRFLAADDLEGKEGGLMTFLVGERASRRQFSKPTAVASYAGVIYVADSGWGTLLTLDMEEESFDIFNDSGPGKLQLPVSIAIDPQGNKFIADTERRQVVQFNAKNEFVAAYGNPKTLRPTGVAVNDQYVYVVNRQAHHVEIYDRRSQSLLRHFGEFGGDEGDFNAPTLITRDDQGHLYVTDAFNFRVQEFDSEGNYIKSFGHLGDVPGTFARPKGLAVDRSGHLYVVDAAFENVQIWDTSMAVVLLAFGGPGMLPSQLYLPSNVAVSYDLNKYFEKYVDPDFTLEYVILVTSNYGPNRLSVYGFVNPKDPSKYVIPPSAEETGATDYEDTTE